MASASGEAEEGFSLPGDFAHTLFETSREALANECHQLFEPFCNEVKGACEAAAKAGQTTVKCTAAIRQDAGVEAVFYEDLKAVFDKTGVHVMRDVERTRLANPYAGLQEGGANVDRLTQGLFIQEAARPGRNIGVQLTEDEMIEVYAQREREVPRGVEYTFVWGTVGNDGLLYETEPMEQATAIKPTRYHGPMQNLNHTQAEDAQMMHHFGHGSLN